MNGDDKDKKSFWYTLPGILTGIAAIIMAGVALYDAVSHDEPDRPMIEEFNCGPAETGSGSQLSWEVTGATQVTIEPGIGKVALKGTKLVRPSETTTYTLTAENKAGSVDATASVEPTKLPTIEQFNCGPAETGSGSQLSWNVSGATQVTIEPGIGKVASTGTKLVRPSETTTYTLTAKNDDGSVDATASVEPDLPTIEQFNCGPAETGDGSQLSWRVSGATQVTIEPDIGNVALTGTRSVCPSETTTYTLTAENDAGSVDATAELVVEPEEKQAVILCSGVYGGNGGTGFEDYVPPDSRICEIRVRSGDWINQVQVVYKTQNGPIIEAPPHGGNGGTLQVFSLQDGEYIEQITGKYGLYIDSMEIVTNMQTRRFGGSGGDNYYSLGCEGCEIVGLLGRSANYLDALGARYKSPPDI